MSKNLSRSKLCIFVTFLLFYSVENTIRRLIKEMKRYIETINGLDKADQRLTYNLSNCQLVHVNEDFRKTVENYHSVTTEVKFKSKTDIQSY